MRCGQLFFSAETPVRLAAQHRGRFGLRPKIVGRTRGVGSFFCTKKDKNCPKRIKGLFLLICPKKDKKDKKHQGYSLGVLKPFKIF